MKRKRLKLNTWTHSDESEIATINRDEVQDMIESLFSSDSSSSRRASTISHYVSEYGQTDSDQSNQSTSQNGQRSDKSQSKESNLSEHSSTHQSKSQSNSQSSRDQQSDVSQKSNREPQFHSMSDDEEISIIETRNDITIRECPRDKSIRTPQRGPHTSSPASPASPASFLETQRFKENTPKSNNKAKLSIQIDNSDLLIPQQALHSSKPSTSKVRTHLPIEMSSKTSKKNN